MIKFSKQQLTIISISDLNPTKWNGPTSTSNFSDNDRQMIEQFFQNSNSPSNAEISFNFTRTSRQMGSNQKHQKDLSPRLQVQEKRVNPQSDIFAFADKELQKFDSCIKNINMNQQKITEKIDAQWKTIEKQFFHHDNSQKNTKNSSSLQSNILQKVDQLHKKITNSLFYPKPCHNCLLSQKKIFELQAHLKQVELNLEAKTLELTKINQIQIKQLGYEMSFEVENRLLSDQVGELMSKNVELCETIQTKNIELNKLNEEINKFHFQKSNFLSKTKTLENRLHEMQKSKSLLMSAAKNSTSHSEFNITTNNTNQTMLKSQNQANIDTTLIHTNQFSAQKPSADDYCQWFDRLKQLYLEKYKKEEKEHLKKFPELKNNQIAMKMEINNFKKGHARYEVARSWNTIANYVSKNKENFLELISHELSPNIKIPLTETCTNTTSQQNGAKETSKMAEFLEEELKKSQKKAEGHLSEIENLNQQLMNLKKTLLKEKQEKTKLSREVIELHQEMGQIQHELDYAKTQLEQMQSQSQSINNNLSVQSPFLEQLVSQLQQNLSELQKELHQKSEELKKAIYESKSQQQAQLKLSQSLKEYERLLYKERVQKIKYFKESLPSQCLTTACRIRGKSMNEKKFNSIVHEFQGRVYVEKEKLSYRFDLVEQVGKKSNDEIYSFTRKMLTSCIYQPTSFVILSMGSVDSEFREYFRGQNGILWSCISEIFKLKFSEKRFLHIDVFLSVVEMTNFQIIDLIDNDRRKNVTLKKQGQKVTLENCMKLQFQTQQQVKSTLSETCSKSLQINSHLITIIDFLITDKRNKQKFTSKIYFTEVSFQNSSDEQSNQNSQNLIKDVKSLWNAFNCINFKQPYQPESNRLACLLSECFVEKSKNLMVINVSPIEFHKQNSMNSLNYASTLKYLSTQKPQSLIRYTQKTPEHSILKLQRNSSHSLIQTPTLNPDTVEEKIRSITKHRNSSSQHTIYVTQNAEKKKRTISRLCIC